MSCGSEMNRLSGPEDARDLTPHSRASVGDGECWDSRGLEGAQTRLQIQRGMWDVLYEETALCVPQTSPGIGGGDGHGAGDGDDVVEVGGGGDGGGLDLEEMRGGKGQ